MAGLGFLLLGAALAGDERVSVVVLPPLGPPAVVESLEAVAVASLPEGFRQQALSESARALFLEHPGCRDQPLCLRDNLPGTADLVLDVRAYEHGGFTVLDLRLLRDGDLYGRRAAALGALPDPDAVARDVAELLSGWERDARLYRMALEGREEAEEQLRARFPQSPWTVSLDRAER